MDINNLQTWHYFAIAGGGVFLLGVILYFLGAGKLTVPSVITSGVGGALAGVALGVVMMASFGYQPQRDPKPDESEPSGATGPKMGPGPGGGGGGGFGKMGGGMGKGMPGGAGPGGFGGGPPRPNPRTQLAGLVNVLDKVADKPVTLNLTDDQRKAITEQLKGLDTAADLKEDDAQARLNAILKVVEQDRATLESVGYRWPVEGKSVSPAAGGPPKDPAANPFKDGQAAEQLKSLLDRLTKK